MQKKIKSFILLLILLSPVIVNADVDKDTEVGIFLTENECQEQLALNNKSLNSSASTGYYLSCIAISCGTSEVVVHQDLEPFADNITCANGNTKPRKVPFDTAIGEGHALTAGATCSLDEEDEDFLELQYATKIDHFNCLLNQDGSTYTSNNNENQTTTEATTNPQTGINTYYIILGSSVVILSTVLSIINKKNLFKKI